MCYHPVRLGVAPDRLVLFNARSLRTNHFLLQRQSTDLEGPNLVANHSAGSQKAPPLCIVLGALWGGGVCNTCGGGGGMGGRR